MPPVVDREEVAGAPVGLALAEEADAVGDPTLHLVGVDDGVDRPHVVGVDGRARPARPPRPRRSARTPRGRRPACRARTAVCGWSGSRASSERPGRSRRLAASPRKKSSWWPTCRASRSVGQRTSSCVERAATAPCQSPATHARDGVVVGLLPLVHRDGGHRRSSASWRHGDVGLVGGREVEVGDEGVAHRRRRRAARRAVVAGRRPRGVAEQRVDRPVVERHGLGGAAHRVAVLVVLSSSRVGVDIGLLQGGRRAHRPLTPLA